jgi:hypothetical protein
VIVTIMFNAVPSLLNSRNDFLRLFRQT